MPKIWGLIYEEVIIDGRIFWKTQINNPFKGKDGKWKIGLNEKFLKEARQRGVEKIILQIGQKEIMMSIPSKEVLRQKIKMKEYEDKPSLFYGSPPMRIYYFDF